jgi:hypothetical protein
MAEYDHMGGPCPRCGDEFHVYPALSRLDNKTYICSDCGVKEALHNFTFPGQTLPPLNVSIY